MRRFAVAIMLTGIAVPGCWRTPPSVVPPAPIISPLPVSVEVRQRSTMPVPGSKDQLSITADDITRGQVMVSLIDRNGKQLMGPVSMKEKDSRNFRLGTQDFSLTLVRLVNSLVGDDTASFSIAGTDGSNGTGLSELQKIERLIAAVESLSETTFIRNGTEHSAADAAKHLRQKLEAARGQVKTASEFIEVVASKSSTTGQEYTLRYADGRTVSTSTFLRDELAKLESRR